MKIRFASINLVKVGVFGLMYIASIGDVSVAQTPTKARVIARAQVADPIYHLNIAPNDAWLLSSSGMGDDFRLWNLKKPGKARALPGQDFAWSREGARLALWDDPNSNGSKGQQRLTILDLNSQKVTQFPLDLPTSDSGLSLEFASDGRAVNLRSSSYKRTIIWTIDARTGKMRGVKETKSSRTTTATSTRHFVQSDYQEVGTQVQVYDLSGRKIYDWHNPSEYDVWELSSDGALMWRSSYNTKRFNFYDAPSGRLLWRLPTTEADSGMFGHYPQWSGDGQSVAFVNGNTLRTYDARTGKVLHSANVDAFDIRAFYRGDAYALSRHGDFVMVADKRNQIWRVPLS